MYSRSITSLIKGLDEKEFSPLELTEQFLKRIKSLGNGLNAFISLDEEGAIAKAKDLKRNTNQPLSGIPIAHKDIFCTLGSKTSCGSKMLDNFISPYDATIVAKLKSAGAICLGKTNMDEFAMGSSNETSYYGPAKNPWNLDYVPGGSSGGSAAATAARLVPACTGSDTGGSIRQPAAYCGITGLKPTYGLVSRWGMIAFASSLDQAGPMANSAEDAAILLTAMSGYDDKDSTSYATAASIDYQAECLTPNKPLTVGIVDDFLTQDLDAQILKRFEETKQILSKLGANFESVQLPSAGLSTSAYYVIAPAECSSNLSRYDGVRYGHRCESPENLTDLYERSRSEGFGKEVKRRIMIGTYALSAGYYDAYYNKAQKIRRLIKNDFDQAFKKVDLILTPTTPTPAFKLGEKVTDPVSMYLNDIYTIPANLAGLPAISFPAGFSGNLPVGMQLIGPAFSESQLLKTVYYFQQETDWHQQIPEAFK